jgi:hypothetical protein
LNRFWQDEHLQVSSGSSLGREHCTHNPARRLVSLYLRAYPALFFLTSDLTIGGYCMIFLFGTVILLTPSRLDDVVQFRLGTGASDVPQVHLILLLALFNHMV